MSEPVPPRTPEIPHTLEAHGVIREDPWYWLRERENAAVCKHLEEENSYVDAVLAPMKEERARILTELKGRIQEDDQSYPFLRGGYLYYQRYMAGQEYPIYARKKGDSGAEEILLDVNELAKGHDFTEVHFPDPSPDSTKIVYAADFEGRRFFDLYVKDLASGELVGEPVVRTTGDVVWAADSRTLLYVKQDPETLRARWVYWHELGGGADRLVFEEVDDTYYVDVADSRTGAFLYIVSSAKLSTEWQVIPASNPSAEPRVFLPREREHEYSLEDGKDAFYVVSNWNATNFRLLRAPHSGGGRENWVEVISHREDVLLEGACYFSSHVVLSERFEGQTRIAVVSRHSDDRKEISFPDPVFVAGVDVNEEYETAFVRYRYESLHRPPSLLDFDFTSGVSTLRRVQPVPNYDSSLYESERKFAVAEDGTRIPISLVYKKGFQKNGKAPLLMYGYGSYGFSMEPWFQNEVVSLLDRGFAYAVAHVRGGSEMGRHWYDDGKLEKKMNTFTDFISATTFLVKNGYGASGRVFANGASAGGLLMGAVANLRPDLFRGLVAGVPFVDVLTTMLDATIPLTTSEYDEWGDPGEKAAYLTMAEYSPYDNIRTGASYPAILATAGFHDSQVQYWEPAKWVARLRKNAKGGPFLLFTEMDAGHGGASGRFQSLEQTALEYAFLLSLNGGV